MFNKCDVFKSLSEGVRSNGEYNLFILQQLPQQWCDIFRAHISKVGPSRLKKCMAKGTGYVFFLMYWSLYNFQTCQ